MALDFGLADRRVIVAGAGQGIGAACCRRFAALGARVLAVDRDPARAGAIADELAAAGASVATAEVDVFAPEGAAAAVQAAVASFGGVDVCVDIVGEARWARLTEMTDDQWHESFATVLTHFFFLARAAGQRMIAQATGGALVGIASLSGVSSAPRHGAYGAAKAGMMALVKTLAVELGAHGIRANCVAPGAVRTPRLEAIMPPERQQESAAAVPLQRLAEPDDIANAVVFLASDLAAYVTGQTLLVDGGATAKFPLTLQA